MAWMQKLCEAYDAAIETSATQEQTPLVPLGFIEKKITYLVLLSEDGQFVSAQELPKQEQSSIVPTTPKAESRSSSKIEPFPLAEQLKYLLCREEEQNPRFDQYMENLTRWSEAPHAPAYLKTLISYLSAKTLAEDLVNALSEKVLTKEKALVCFAINDADAEARLWCRPDLIESWSRFSAEAEDGEKTLCYVTGEQLPAMDKHPKVEGNAKLISSKDDCFRFQYKGRFTENDSAVKVSSLASTKAHNALKWLTARQGLRKFGMTFLAWNTNGSPVQVPIADAEGFSDEDDDVPDKPLPDTLENYSLSLKEAADGYGARLRNYKTETLSSQVQKRINEVDILCLEAATNGRLSITYYQEIPGNIYVDRLRKWYSDCCWELLLASGKQGIASPTTNEIVRAVLGEEQLRLAKQDFGCKKTATKQVRELSLRLLMCITQDAQLPLPYVKQAVCRSRNPLAFTDSKGKWQSFRWAQCLAVTCALIRRSRIDRGIDASDKGIAPRLDTANHDRSYLFGRLLAVADRIEQAATKDYKNPTNAIRLMSRFVNRPAETWLQLHSKLVPYFKAAITEFHSADAYQSLIGNIEAAFSPIDRACNEPLSELFLVGFYTQQQKLRGTWDATQELDAVPPFLPPTARDELFGCLFAVADVAEWRAKSHRRDGKLVSDRDGMTNALRSLPAAATTPNTTWAQVHDRLIPYLEELGVAQAERLQELLEKIECRFQLEARCTDTPLSGMYLRGYYLMRNALRHRGLAMDAWRQKQSVSASLLSREALFGALLAVENQTERVALDLQYGKDSEQNRPSNTMRFLTRIAMRPNEVWSYLDRRRRPYEKKVSWLHSEQKSAKLQASINDNRWNTDVPLKPEYLHYFYTYLNMEENTLCQL